ITQGQCASAQYAGVWDAAKMVCHPTARDCFAWAKFWAGGYTYYGGFLGASVAAWFLLKRDRMPFWKGADIAGLVVPLGLGFGRMGCLLVGCCFGKVWKAPYGLSFPSDSPASELQYRAHLLDSPLQASLPVHPTQIYESFVCLMIAGLLMFRLHGRKSYDGQVFLAFVTLYAAARFVLEFWRSDDRGGLLGLSTSQLIGVALVAAAAILHIRLVRQITERESHGRQAA
ncbi:MAG TPA: prolipoprotein diacylglyceryl transferase family protein, partial [Polyangiaceae bacterium]